jgi:organic radical activating enzyme
MHHFIRLAGCGAGCSFCDTRGAQEKVDTYLMEGRSKGKNPVTPSRAADLVAQMEASAPGAQAVAVTGGEPLEQGAFLDEMLDILRKGDMNHLPVLLETGGLVPEAMIRLKEKVDMVSMDIKLPTTSGIKDSFTLHQRFLRVLQDTAFYLKIVVNEKTPVEELEEAAAMIAQEAKDATLFIQPETKEARPVPGAYLLPLWTRARHRIRDVRILPQVHPFLGLK